tara:strand:- start:4 stop:183 length:180 start_codon:yes stop_codon:yes gene_type:complete
VEIHLFKSLALTSFLGKIENLHLYLNYLVRIFEKLFNEEKMQIYFVESLLPQALWVAGK